MQEYLAIHDIDAVIDAARQRVMQLTPSCPIEMLYECFQEANGVDKQKSCTWCPLTVYNLVVMEMRYPDRYQDTSTYLANLYSNMATKANDGTLKFPSSVLRTLIKSLTVLPLHVVKEHLKRYDSLPSNVSFSEFRNAICVGVSVTETYKALHQLYLAYDSKGNARSFLTQLAFEGIHLGQDPSQALRPLGHLLCNDNEGDTFGDFSALFLQYITNSQ